MPELQVDIKPRIDPAAAAQAGKQLADQLSAQATVRPHFDPVAREMQSMERRMARNAARVSARQRMFGETEEEALQALRLAPRDPHARIAAAADSSSTGLIASAQNAMRAAGPLLVATGAIGAAANVARIGRSVATMVGGRDSITRLEAEQQMHERIGSLGPPGWAYGAMREITGDQRWLERRIAGARAQEEIAPQLAGLRGGNFAQERLRIEAEYSARMRTLNPDAKPLAKLPSEAQFGIRYAQELRQESIDANRRAMRADRIGGIGDIEASGLEVQRDFSGAARRRAYARRDAAIMAAPENERGFVTAVEDARLNRDLAQIGFEQRERSKGLQSRAMVDEVIARSGNGMQMLAGTVGKIQSLQAEMRAAPRDDMTQMAAAGAYSSALRAMEASLLPRGGGLATTRAPGTEIIGDPLGIEAATRDREFSLKAIRAARTAFGDDTPVTNESRSEAMLDVLKQILGAVSTDPLSQQPVQ